LFHQDLDFEFRELDWAMRIFKAGFVKDEEN